MVLEGTFSVLYLLEVEEVFATFNVHEYLTFSAFSVFILAAMHLCDFEHFWSKSPLRLQRFETEGN